VTTGVFAQVKDTSKTIPVHIKNSKNYYHIQTDSGEYNKFIDDVVLQQGTDILYCDSAYMNQTTHNFEAFGDVKITQADGTEAKSNYLRYISDSKTAFMRGNVSLNDNKGKLWCDELTYNLNTKIGVYDHGGRLVSDSTTVTSNTGEYNVKTKDATFKGNAIITDPQYHITSESLVYNTGTKITRFFAPSIVNSDKMTLVTSSGAYDSHEGLADFSDHSSIWNDGQYIEADTLHYDKRTGFGFAYGHVVSIDTAHHSTIYCRHAQYYRKKKILWAVGDPVLKQVNGKDTIYIYADTFYSAPMVIPKLLPTDTVAKAATIKTAKKKSKLPQAEKPKLELAPPTMAFDDTSKTDTTAPSYFTGYHHVLIFSDSLQGKCDSIVYTMSDSVIKMIYSPIAWAHKSQITGDTILLKLDSNSLKSIYVPNNAFTVSQSGPAKAHLYDQVQGKRLKGYFKNNSIHQMVVYPDAQAIYYPTDNKGAYIGVNQSNSDTINAYFENQALIRIKLDNENHVKLTPITKADLPSMKLSRFKWLIDQRPKSKEELFKPGLLIK